MIRLLYFLYGSVFGGSHRSAKEDCPKLDGMPGGTDQYCAAGTALPYGNSGSPAAVPCRDHHRRNWWRRCELVGACGLVLGLYQTVIGLILALSLLILWHIVRTVTTGRKEKQAYPLVPFLLLGMFISVLTGG